MITFSAKSLPFSEHVYIAFRIAILETEERLALANQIDLTDHTGFGYLTQVPFLRTVAPQVQLDLLLDFWNRYLEKKRFTSDYLDESIVYAVCETAANVIRSQPSIAQRMIETGPLTCPFSPTSEYAEEIQKLHLQYVGEGHFLLLSQFLDIDPEDAENMKVEYGVSEEKCESMYDAVGRWHVSHEIADRAVGLLTDSEVKRFEELFKNSTSLRKLSE